MGIAEHAVVGLMGEQGEGPRTRVAALGDGTGVATCRITATGHGMTIKAACRCCGSSSGAPCVSQPAHNLGCRTDASQRAG
jgi:hypothetical protein